MGKGMDKGRTVKNILLFYLEGSLEEYDKYV